MTRPLAEQFAAYAAQAGILDESYVVGGAVRDLLLGQESSDYDLVVPAESAEMHANMFADAIGARFVLLDDEFGILRIARNDAYLDLCRMQGPTIVADLRNRDITINALALPLKDLGSADWQDRLIDPCNGRSDLAHKTIRMVAEQNLLQDPLRMARIYRFTCQLSFMPDLQTLAAVRTNAGLIHTVAVERIGTELRYILHADSSYATIKMMERDLLLLEIFPELRTQSPGARKKMLQSYGYLEHILNNPALYFFDHAEPVAAFFAEPERRLALKLAVLLTSPQALTAAAERLRMTRSEMQAIRAMTAGMDGLCDLMAADTADRLYAIHRMQATLYPLLIFLISQECICQMVDSPTAYFCREMLDLFHGPYRERSTLIPLLTGHDIMTTLSVKQSPAIGALLAELERMTLDGRISTRNEALAAAASWIDRNPASTL